MNKKNQIDLIRKRNIELSNQLNDIKFKMEFDNRLNMEGYKHAKELITDLEKIKSDWLQTLEEIQNYKVQYLVLIDDLKKIKKIMSKSGFKIPLYKRISLWVKRKLNPNND